MRRIGDASWRRFGTQTDAAKAFGLYQSEVSQIVNDRSKASGRALLYEARRVAAVSEPPVATVEPTPAAPLATKPSRARRLADDLSDDDDAPAPKRAKSTRPPRWTSDEEARLRTLAGELEGRDKWAVIAERLGTGRTANGVEVKWYKLKAKNAAAPPPPPVAPATAPAAEQMVARGTPYIVGSRQRRHPWGRKRQVTGSTSTASRTSTAGRRPRRRSASDRATATDSAAAVDRRSRSAVAVDRRRESARRESAAGRTRRAGSRRADIYHHHGGRPADYTNAEPLSPYQQLLSRPSSGGATAGSGAACPCIYL